ncbi:MAG: DUF6324 family protein [Pseudomonadota bacterium]
MNINRESDQSANLMIGPTSLGMVRIYIEGDGVDLPMDFAPDEAREIAEELLAAAEKAQGLGTPAGRGGGKPRGPKARKT